MSAYSTFPIPYPTPTPTPLTQPWTKGVKKGGHVPSLLLKHLSPLIRELLSGAGIDVLTEFLARGIDTYR